jgi:hypothetical protein
MSWNSVWEQNETKQPTEMYLNISVPKTIFDDRNEEFEQQWKSSADVLRCDRSKGAIPQIKVQPQEAWSDTLKHQHKRNAFDQATDQHIKPAAPHLATKMQESISSTTLKNAYSEKFPDPMCVRVHDWESDEIHRSDGLGVFRDGRPAMLEHENMRTEHCNNAIMVQEFTDDQAITTVDCGVTNQNNASFI